MKTIISQRFALSAGCAAAALACAIAAAPAAQAQVRAAEVTAVKVSEDGVEVTDVIIVTGSRIKRDPTTSSVPLEVITTDDLRQNGITSAEALNMYLTASSTSSDNLASTSDVTTDEFRGANGLSAANLRGQGAGATLVLLNNRRVAAHGLSGRAVDVNQIPFAALDRVEVLKDGASAIYGTDAIGGVINYITKTDFQGLQLDGYSSITEHGDAPVYRISATAGYGDIDDQGFNIMGAISYNSRGALRGNQRDFVNTNQPDRGLSVDTRGTPLATITRYWWPSNPGAVYFAPNGALTHANGISLTAPNGADATRGGINVLDLPGGAGCESMDGGMAYDHELWANDSAFYACAWDTGRAVTLQQPIDTLTYYGKATVALGASELAFEITGSDAKSDKRFSNLQVFGGSFTPVYYPLNGTTQATYDAIFNQLVAAFPNDAAALQGNYGLPIGYRWRCIPCGERELSTDSKTMRLFASLDGPLPWESWDYSLGASRATSDVVSTLGRGYYYRGVDVTSSFGAGRGLPDNRAPTAPGATDPGLVGLLNSGILNPFSLTQTPQALAALEAVSAEGVRLFGGKYTVTQFDGSISGPIFALSGGDAQIAVGFDYRREEYTFNGADADIQAGPNIYAAPFDNQNALDKAKRNVKAGYIEVDLPFHEMFTLTGALRVDDYTGFGSTTNPKVSGRFEPADWIAFRGSYSTGFRVPNFNQIFNGVTESQYLGADLADPANCPGGVPDTNDPACGAIQPVIWTGGNTELGPETAKMYSVGVVLRPTANISLTADYWNIAVEDRISTLSLRQLVENYDLFPDKFLRDGTGQISIVDRRWLNAGSSRTSGIDFAGRGSFPAGSGSIELGMDGTWLLKKKQRLLPDAPFDDDEVGRYVFQSDLGLKWKHNLWLGYRADAYSVRLTNIYRSGYDNQQLPGIANGTVTRPGFNEKVKAYSIFNLSATYNGLDPDFNITFTIENLFDKDPPFAVTYDSNTGAGSSWDPRVANPRGRAFSVAVSTKF